ncbi:MAG: xylulokinase [Hydrogenophaga sp.]|uniref:xylulokinase n=1 Tax=Hydrogenophaga sp. TaxID=1904254 RepID=UPI001DC5B45E|nr:xylulokinase [Hydrogenophaga sp.]MBX3609390.1 xylulokinase [Hydrogenophaga sp.]
MFLGLDLGTSELKALLLSPSHEVIATAHAPLSVQHPQPLWAEQAPADWWRALEDVMGQLQRAHAPAMAQVQGLGLSGQMHGAVLLGQAGEVLRPAILWNDGRSADQCAQLQRLVPQLSDITGNLAMPGFTAPKLLWVRANEPELFARTQRVLLPKDWLRLKLTGEAVSDMSDAAGTLWLDTARRDWSDRMLAACGLNRSHMPRLVEGSALSAQVLPQLCARWGLPAQVAVAGGAGDNAASAMGLGLVEPGQGFVSLGTSGVVFVVGERFAPDPAHAVHAFCHAVPQRWHQMSVMLSAASAVTWAASRLGYADEAALLADAATLTPQQQAQAPMFLPYLSGERSPHNDPQARAAWLGMTAAHTRADLAWAVVEGVSFGLRDGLLTLGGPIDNRGLALVGGGARSLWWGQVLSDVLGLPLWRPAHAGVAAAMGAARLGWLAAGGDIAEVCRPVAAASTLQPDRDAHARHLLRHARWRAMYAGAARAPGPAV